MTSQLLVAQETALAADVPADKPLPRDFVWGVSTSSYQIEGAAELDGRGPSIWDIFCRTPDRIANGDTGDRACDHYHRYAEDIALMRQIGVGAYRFSVSWPRVLPMGRGTANEPGLAFYDRLVDGLLAVNIEPWLCLYHWDLPQALQDLGGWTNRDIVRWFADYDWLGINHFSPIYARSDPAAPLGFAWADAPPEVRRSPIGWQIDPAAFRDTLLDAHDRYGAPIYVLENGAGAVEKPDVSGQVIDPERIDYLAPYIDAMQEAVARGADVRGYFVWSLLDNFEWGAGYATRFGLVYVDYVTQRRIPKASARWSADLIRARAIRPVR